VFGRGADQLTPAPADGLIPLGGNGGFTAADDADSLLGPPTLQELDTQEHAADA